MVCCVFLRVACIVLLCGVVIVLCYGMHCHVLLCGSVLKCSVVVCDSCVVFVFSVLSCFVVTRVCCDVCCSVVWRGA